MTTRRRRFQKISTTADSIFAVCEEGRVWELRSGKGLRWIELPGLPPIEDGPPLDPAEPTEAP